MPKSVFNETEIKLHITDYINKAFEVLPTNSFINKGRCGVGGTHLELKTKRNSIIVVPIKGIITDKIDSTDENGNLEYPNLFPILGGVTVKQIEEYLLKNIPFKKIIVTPDSLPKIITAAKNLDLLESLFSDYYLVLDEAHSIVTESFRESMIKAFELHFQFKNRIIISATPFYFTDPRLKNLDYYRITFHEKLGKINILNAKSVRTCVNEFLTEKKETKGNMHIFYNSVTEIAEAIELAELKDCNVHCSENEKNLAKIGKFFKPQPIKGEYKKINFYTTSHFEGWNLEDINPTLILVTDIHNTHSKIGISNKGVQAIGRQRIKENKPETQPYEIYHITNHRNMKTIKTLEDIKNEYFFDAEWDAAEYNRYVEACKLRGRKPSKDKTEFVKRYAEINDETGLAEISHLKINQYMNESVCNEEFNHIDYIQQAWENAVFETDIKVHIETTDKKIQRKTSKSVKDILENFELLDPKNEFIFQTENNIEKLSRLKTDYPILYKAHKLLTLEEIESTNCNAKDIEKLIILKTNKNAEMKVLKLLPLYFTVGQRYTKAKIKEKLQEIYDKAGFQKTATAEQLGSLEWYEIKPCKVKNKNNVFENGFLILRMNFKLTVSSR